MKYSFVFFLNESHFEYEAVFCIAERVHSYVRARPLTLTHAAIVYIIVFALILPQLPYAKLLTFAIMPIYSVCVGLFLFIIMVVVVVAVVSCCCCCCSVGCSTNRAISKSPNRKMWWLFFRVHSRIRAF